MPGREASRSDPLSQDEYVEQANEICEQTRNEAAQIAAPSLADPAAVVAAIDESVAIQRRALRRLRNLEAPERDLPGVENWLDLTAGAITEAENVGEGVADGDQEAIMAALDEGETLVAEAEEFAAAYGLTECSTADPEDDEQAP